ncbi:hypothetical protein [Flavobacterium sp.]|uniref:hypothetical protein n=1 Tax=Flavobacterium sp. TaxID=239 RepID=UPI003D6AF2B8
MKNKIASIIFGLFLLSCTGQKKAVNNAMGDEKLAIISNPEYTKYILGKTYEMWKPEESDLKKVNEILSKAISDNQFYFLKTKEISEIKKNYRQYLCYINEKGEKIIYVNSMCELFTDYDKNNKPVIFDWKHEMTKTADGGSCYWNIKINITTNTYYDLMINGIS